MRVMNADPKYTPAQVATIAEAFESEYDITAQQLAKRMKEAGTPELLAALTVDYREVVAKAQSYGHMARMIRQSLKA